MKIKRSFYKDNIYIIAQSPHCGLAQACRAMDFGWSGYADKNLYAPCDMTFKRKWNDGVEYWVDGCEGTYIQFVHVKPVNDYNKKEGSKFGNFINDHTHLAINVKGTWGVYLDYVDRGAELFFWTYGQKHDKWSDWNTYTNREIICYTNEMKEIFSFNFFLNLETTNTVDLNIRKEPNTTSAILGKVPPKTKFQTNQIVSGEDVGNQPIWFKYGEGWISGKYVRDLTVLADCTETQRKLDAALAYIEVLKAELDSFKPLTYYTKD